MRWRLSHVYYERIPFLRLSACTTWFCSVRRPVDVLFEYYQSRKCSWIEKNPNFIALCFKIIQRSPPQSPSQREITCQTFVSVVEIDMLPNCQSVDKMSQSLLASQHADVARFACLLVPVRVERTVGGQGLALGSLLEAVSPVSGAPCRESERLLDGEYFAVFS